MTTVHHRYATVKGQRLFYREADSCSPAASRPTPASTKRTSAPPSQLCPAPSARRQVLTGIYYRDRSVTETARVMQIPPGTVRSRTFYGLRALRRILAAQDAVADPLPPAAPGHGRNRRPPSRNRRRSEKDPDAGTWPQRQ
jgi:hypothetical protein